MMLLRNGDASAFADRWRPQVVAETLVQTPNFPDYIRAKIELSACDALLAHEDMHAFVVDTSTPCQWVVRAALWASADVDRAECLLRAQEWCEDRNVRLVTP